ncbi:hypothetical protein ACLB2K_017007 [Fragaria x ananassa]
MLGVRAREGNGERHSDPESDDVLTDDDDFFRRLKVPRTFYSRNSTPIIIGERTCEETGGEEDAQSEEEEGEQSEEGEEAQEDDEYQEDDDDMNVDEELTNLPLNVGDQEDHSLTSASREERGGEEEDAQSEEAEGEQDHHQSEQEVEEGQQSEEDEEYQEEDEVQEDYDDMNVGEEFINLLINVGYQEGHRSTSASREETGGEQDAQSEEVEGEQDHHQSEQEVEEGQQWEEDEVYQEDDEDHEEDDDLNVNDELNNRPHVGDQEGCSSTSSSMEGCNIVITLTDSGLLDCPICFEPLTIPVYQCDPNGHIACSLCSIKIDNKCPFCNRCRAIEKVVESSTTP